MAGVLQHRSFCRTAEVDVAAPREVVSCEECGDQFTVKQLLDNHRRRKHMQRPQEKHQCAHCPNSSNNRPLECPDCGQRFTQASKMPSHRRLQHRPKALDVTCAPKCGMRFARRGAAKRHEQVVHGCQYPMHCPRCGKGCLNMKRRRQRVQTTANKGKSTPGRKSWTTQDIARNK
ncbi:hypothetical protein HPB49_010251 [Dermacentor silvarum]|uniref:Uncharacterized protein n=1 Tax=Dermacentor silvarum TaxID=543639 RepID=A0ACB8C2W8_DERSI|nr:hypothetical protein HPB49_010251 [Dermacentor silvarum]